MANKSKDSSAIGVQVDQPSLEDQLKSKEENIVNNIIRWMIDHKNIVPLGEDEPALDLLVAFIKSVKTKILKLNNRPETIAAACIRLYSGQDTQIEATVEELEDYFKIRQKVLSSVVSKLCPDFLYFVAAKGCTLKFETGGHYRLLMAGTPIEKLIAVGRTILGRGTGELVVVDEKGNVVNKVDPKELYCVIKDKRKKMIAKYKNDANRHEYSQLLQSPMN